MKRTRRRLTIDRTADALYLRVRPGKVDSTICLLTQLRKAWVTIDVDSKRRVLGIELVGISHSDIRG